MKVMFTVEEAWWFYTDYYCDQHASLPRLDLARCAAALFGVSSRLQRWRGRHEELASAFKTYKRTVASPLGSSAVGAGSTVGLFQRQCLRRRLRARPPPRLPPGEGPPREPSSLPSPPSPIHHPRPRPLHLRSPCAGPFF